MWFIWLSNFQVVYFLQENENLVEEIKSLNMKLLIKEEKLHNADEVRLYSTSVNFAI